MYGYLLHNNAAPAVVAGAALYALYYRVLLHNYFV